MKSLCSKPWEGWAQGLLRVVNIKAIQQLFACNLGARDAAALLDSRPGLEQVRSTPRADGMLRGCTARSY